LRWSRTRVRCKVCLWRWSLAFLGCAMAYHPIDVQVGARVRQCRALLGMSQAVMAKAVGLTFQQIQKYEHGDNRISASRLYEFARVLDVPVSYFFEAMPSAATRRNSKHVAPPKSRSRDPLVKRESLELVRAFYKIGNTNVRRAIVNAVRSLG
jgi:transcriptional regulator with XRE-family HTH domain